MDLGADAQLSSYGDDLAVLVAGNTKEKIIGRTCRVAGLVVNKLCDLGWKLPWTRLR